MATPSAAPKTAAEAEQRFFARFGDPYGLHTWEDVQSHLGPVADLIPRPATVEAWIAVAEHVRRRQARPATLGAAAPALAAAFEAYQVDIKPGALTQDKKRALALAYVDLRAYQDRLDEVVGLEGWSVEYRTLGAKSIICRLSILGHVREDVGEPSGDGENPATEALAQSFKRACSAFGLGRYLYSLPRLWADYDADKKQFVDAAGTVQLIYQRGGLLTKAPAPARGVGGR